MPKLFLYGSSTGLNGLTAHIYGQQLYVQDLYTTTKPILKSPSMTKKPPKV